MIKNISLHSLSSNIFHNLREFFFIFGFFSIFLIYLDLPIFSGKLHKPILYFFFIFVLFLTSNLDKNFVKFYNSSFDKIIFSLIFFSIIINLSVNINFEIAYIYGLISIIFCLCTFFIGPNLEKIINFRNLVIINSLIIFFTIVMILPHNTISQGICTPMIELFPRVFCASISGFFRGASIFTPEPSFAAIQNFFLLICNMFYISKISNSNYEKFILIIFTALISLCSLLIKSKLGYFFSFIVFVTLIIYLLSKYKYFKTILFLIFVSTIFIFSMFENMYANFIAGSFDLQCNNLLWSLIFRLLGYISILNIGEMNIFNILFNSLDLHNIFNNFNSNQIYTNQFEKSFYLTHICNTAILNEIQSSPIFLQPQPLFLKLFFNSGFVLFLLFAVFVFKNIIINYENEIYKILIIVFLIYLFFIQSSFLLIYQGIAYQIYMYRK